MSYQKNRIFVFCLCLSVGVVLLAGSVHGKEEQTDQYYERYQLWQDVNRNLTGEKANEEDEAEPDKDTMPVGKQAIAPLQKTNQNIVELPGDTESGMFYFPGPPFSGDDLWVFPRGILIWQKYLMLHEPNKHTEYFKKINYSDKLWLQEIEEIQHYGTKKADDFGVLTRESTLEAPGGLRGHIFHLENKSDSNYIPKMHTDFTYAMAIPSMIAPGKDGYIVVIHLPANKQTSQEAQE